MNYLIVILLFILGSVLGSFLACMGYRIPNKIKTTHPASFCENCKGKLKWYMNIPIISYIFLKGKCYYCHKPIGFIYFLSELICGILFVTNYLIYGFSMNFFVGIILTCILIVTIVSDFKYYYISDRVLLISTALLLITFLVFMDYSDLIMRVVSALILFLVMIGLKIMGNAMFNTESLGDGDIKLMAVIGLAMGMLNSFISLFFAAVIGLIFSLFTLKKNKEGIIPFGPFIIMGALLVIYLSNYIVPYMEELLSI